MTGQQPDPDQPCGCQPSNAGAHRTRCPDWQRVERQERGRTVYTWTPRQPDPEEK